jgi:hypothetical protein
MDNDWGIFFLGGGSFAMIKYLVLHIGCYQNCYDSVIIKFTINITNHGCFAVCMFKKNENHILGDHTMTGHNNFNIKRDILH